MKIYHTLITWLVLALTAMTVASCSDDDDEAAMRYPAPTITGFSPSEGLPTNIVTITGTEFGSSRTERVGRVYFGGVEATEYVSWSDNEIQVRVPDGGVSGPITLWVWKNHVETAEEFTCIPGAEITGISPSPAFPGATLEVSGRNFQYFIDKQLPLEDIDVEFTAEKGTTRGKVTALSVSSLSVEIPVDAKRGTFTVAFGEYQTVTGPELVLVGDMTFTLTDFVEKGGDTDPTVSESVIESTRNGSYIIYEFVAPATGLFDVYTMAATNREDSYLNVNIGESITALKTGTLNENLTRPMVNGGNWTTDSRADYGPFYLTEGKTYYLMIMFIRTVDNSWVGNVHEVGLTLSADQNATPENPSGDAAADYVLYAQDFNSGTSYLPFRDGWAYAPSYIKIVDQALEFYYNHEALEQDNIRQRRGCEITCDFHTTTEGWYGFRFYLPEGKFPMDESGIIIAQIFGQGCKNSWAGHLSIDNGVLKLSHRRALIDPTVEELGRLETGKWYSVIVHFKAGRNGKGRLWAWLGDNLTESSPVYDSGSCDFGFAHWIDDETLDDTGTNPECTGYKGTYDALGCKFGLYVSNTVDITIRFDDIKALEGNPSGAFDIVKP